MRSANFLRQLVAEAGPDKDAFVEDGLPKLAGPLAVAAEPLAAETMVAEASPSEPLALVASVSETSVLVGSAEPRSAFAAPETEDALESLADTLQLEPQTV